jgi:2-C-methyl-D-erythritol 4-phosphate cytidylyltransferase
MKTSVIIVAAGQGERFGGEVPKPFYSLKGQPILAHVLKAFDEVDEVEEMIVVLRHDMIGEFWENWVQKFNFKKLIKTTTGGAKRADSVWNGLQQISKEHEVVLVHDAARPLIDAALIKNVIHSAHQWGGVIPGLKIKPTVKELDSDGFIVKTHNREHLWEAQTPQGFRVQLLNQAYVKAGERSADATDEAYLLEKAGMRVKVIDGDPKNIKITTQEDVSFAERWIKEWK